jgi:hypothetical protein
VKFGLAAWSNKHFDHILYPLRTKHREWLPRYATVFPVVEADILHHQNADAEALAGLAAWPVGSRVRRRAHWGESLGVGSGWKSRAAALVRCPAPPDRIVVA